MEFEFVTSVNLRRLVGIEKIEEVIKYLHRFAYQIADKDLENDLDILLSRFNRVNQALKNALISNSEASQEQNLITRSILLIISDLEKKYGNSFKIVNEETNHGNENSAHEILSDLAREMAFNHFTVSFGESQKKYDGQRAHDVFNKKNKLGQVYQRRPEKRRRNILLVGAGATHQSCPYIPFGPRLKDYLETSPEAMDKKIVAESKIKMRSSSFTDKEGRFNPERYLGLIHDKFKDDDNQDVLRDFLKRVYNRRYMPTHTYEVIAHLFKHSFFTVIINFNFDELLDEAIEEEMGKQKYFKVLHDGDCVDFEKLFIDGRLKTPVYIKIHGTASQKSSLKITENHDFFLSPDMRSFVDKCLEGLIVNPLNPEYEQIPVNLISLGFDLDRFDFRNQIKYSRLHPDSKWYQINWNKEMPPITVKNGDTTFELKSKHIKLKDWKNKNNDIPALADLLIRLYDDHIVKIFDEKFPPRGISRHLIVANLFYLSVEHGRHEDYNEPEKVRKIYKRLIGYFREPRYFFERTVIEIAISIIKNKGIIEPRESSREKIGYFYKKYKDLLEFKMEEAQRKNKPVIDGNDIKDYEKKVFSLNEIYNVFRLTNTYSFSNNLLNLSPFDKDKDDWIDSDRTQILRKLMGQSLADDLMNPEDLNNPDNLPVLVFYRLLKNMRHMEVLQNIETLVNTGEMNFNWYKDVVKHAENIFTGYTYDIKPLFADESLLHFNSVKKEHTLHTNLALTYHFSEFLKRHDEWDICLFISERGKLFSSNYFTNAELLDTAGNFLGSFSDKLIVSISCQEAVAKALNFNEKIQTSEHIIEVIKKAKSSFGYTGLKMHYCLLPYWRHHHHMILFLKTRKDPPGTAFSSFIKIPGSDQKYLHLLRSIYYFKQGFSNTISPVLFPTDGKNEQEQLFIKDDQQFLLTTFFAHYIKSLYYQNKGNAIPVINQDLSYDFKVQEIIGGKEVIKTVNISYERDFLNALFEKNLDNLLPSNIIW